MDGVNDYFILDFTDHSTYLLLSALWKNIKSNFTLSENIKLMREA
jgi:hypothetical protein